MGLNGIIGCQTTQFAIKDNRSNEFSATQTGLDLVANDKFASFSGKRVAFLGHPASVDHKLSHLLDLALKHGVRIAQLFGPEHGFLGNAQDMQVVSQLTHQGTSLPVISLYGSNADSLKMNPQDLRDVDVLICDLQDVGSRYYTFIYTLAFAMRACAKTKTKCVVLDRPNPIGGELVEGNDVLPKYRSFVGQFPLANRHGMTIGELALLFKATDSPDCDLEVVWMQNWQRKMLFAQTGLPWVFPSPNMPTPDTALVYPGACLIEGTNLSEGRGTTRPFELVGAPYIDDPDRFANLANKHQMQGAMLRPCWFSPTFQKHAGKLCGGLQVHITDANRFRPLQAYVAILWAARQFEGFGWRKETYEFVSDRLAIDLLFGDDQQRLILEKGGSPQDVMSSMQAGNDRFAKLRQDYLHSGY